ncbi:19205_t:CDS:2 [Gigaspora rosea]|nr:19205_t:CDS:2 [Gigaspora rosea]
MESEVRGKEKKHLHDRIFVKRPILCCCCINLRVGVIIITVLLLLHGICEAAIAFSGVETYVSRLPKIAAIGFGVLYVLVIPVAVFVWRDDIIENCENDISYLVPSNSSTSTVPYSPNAPNQNVINKACTQGVNLFLLWSAIKFLIFNLLLSVYFGTIVEAFSREELQKQDLQKQELIS